MGNEWGTNGKAVVKFKWSVLPFVINGNLMAYYREHSSGTYFHLALMLVQWHITENTVEVLISIQD